ncbi:hypothetical protein CR513_27796, partial [Mucuna pruriens]
MASSSFNMKDLSPKFKLMMNSSDDNDESCNSKSSRSHRSEKVVKRHGRTHNEQKKSLWDLIKGKIPPFYGNSSVDDYYD